jgi:hypothetical protein
VQMVPLDRIDHPALRSAVSIHELALPDFSNPREIRCPFKSPVRVMMSAVALLAWSKTTSSESCSSSAEQVTTS